MIDIWSLGVLLYEMCKLEYPFQGKSISELTTAIIQSKQKDIPDIYSKDIKDIVKGMLRKEPHKRPNIKQVLRHPKIEGTLSKIGQPSNNALLNQNDDTAADEERDDDDSVMEGESSTGPTRNLEFDIDPLQKLTMDEFI